MGSITSGIGLISGIDTASLIESLITLESGSKFALQRRIASLQAQQSAMLDINARLLNFKNASRTFRIDKIFQSAKAASSNESLLTATASASAQPGTFSFVVKQLVAHSQKLTKGFASSSSALGLESLTFSFGQGVLNRDRPLSELNGGSGVAAGKIRITDRTGAQATIDLTDAVTLNEVLTRINAESGIGVTAAVQGDRLVLNDTTGGGGTLTVANVGGGTTAGDLGILGSAPGNTLTGSIINTLGGNSSLASLNDGTGVLVRNHVTDFRITARNGLVFDVDLGRINADLTNDTPLANLNNGAGVKISADNDNPDIKFVARDGTEYEVNLTGVTTLGELIARVDAATSGHIQISITDGDRLTVTDTVGGAGSLRILGAGANGDKTAQDLGIFNAVGVESDSFVGTLLPNTEQNPAATTIGDVIARINQQAQDAGVDIVASLGDDGASLKITDNTGGSGALIIRSAVTNPTVAAQLGIETHELGVMADEVAGRRLIASLGSVLTNSLNGGAGLNGASSLTLTDRSGATTTLNNLDQLHSLSEIVDAINNAGLAITASLNASGTGLRLTDTSGQTTSNLIVSGDAAAALGIEADVAANTVNGSHLRTQYVSNATKLSDLNYGRGIGLGSFRIIDGLGISRTININANQTNLQDIIQVINAQGFGVRARVNDTGDGLLLEENLEPGQEAFAPIRVESVSGTTAKDLNILGTSSTVEGGFINGGYTRTVAFDAGDSLTQVVSKINAAGIPLNASVLNAGGGANPYRINFTSQIGGALGDLIIDSGGFDLGLATLTKGQDAKVYFGGAGEDGGFLITSRTNTVSGVIDGVTLNLNGVSQDAVTITISRDTERILTTVNQFVVTFNDVLGRINDYDRFDVETQQKGVLLGNPTTARLRDVLFRTLRQRAEGVSTQYQYLSDVGIRIGTEGRITFDEAKFQQAYEADPQAVENLFAAYESTPVTQEEIEPGVFVQSGGANVTARGFGDIFNDLLESLTNPGDGTLSRADQNFKSLIDLSKKRVEAMDVRLGARRLQLQRQFAAMEAALAQLQGQSGALASLAGNVSLAGNLFRRN